MKTIAGLLLSAWLLTLPVEYSWAATAKGSSSSGGSAARFSGGFSSTRSTSSTAPSNSKSSFGSFSKKSTEADRPASRKSALSQDLQRNQSEQRARDSMMAREQAKRDAEQAQRQQTAQSGRSYGATPGTDFGRSNQSGYGNNQYGNNQYGNANRNNYPQQPAPVYQSQSDQQAARNRMIAAGAVGVAVGTMMGNANAHGQQAPQPARSPDQRYEPIANGENGQGGGYGKGFEGGVISVDPAATPVNQTVEKSAVTERAAKAAPVKEESGGFFKYLLIFALIAGLLIYLNRRKRKVKQETERYHLGKV